MDIDKLKQDFNREFESAQNKAGLEQIRVKYLGRKGLLTNILRSLKDFPLEQKREIGPVANQLKEEWENKIKLKIADFEQNSAFGKNFDISRPGKKIQFGHLHPISQALNEIIRIFSQMGFSVAEGPEIETEFNNFTALNIPPEHPARGMHDTFWLEKNKAKPQESKNKDAENYLLRPQTSPVQIRYMQNNQPPFRIISPGQVYRYEQLDATHSHQFRQIEALMVDEKVSVANLLAVIEIFLSRFFGQKIQARVRPSYFPFVEPGLEVDIKMNGRWLEMGGAGMVHPNVFKNVGYSPVWTGFAFGFGWERLTMMKYGIPDLRLFYTGDLRFINQF